MTLVTFDRVHINSIACITSITSIALASISALSTVFLTHCGWLGAFSVNLEKDPQRSRWSEEALHDVCRASSHRWDNFAALGNALVRRLTTRGALEPIIGLNRLTEKGAERSLSESITRLGSRKTTGTPLLRVERSHGNKEP